MPSPVLNLDALALQSRGNGGQFQARYARIGGELGLHKLGCNLFVVPPGKSAFPCHAHSTIEEMALVLEGEGQLRLDDERYPIRAGDVLALRVGSAHRIYNSSEQDLRYLVFASNQAVDVVYYPDSDKVLAASEVLPEGAMHISRRQDACDYYDGE